ncbi:Pyrroline-5-carboxylate reductase [hydrothermal vent metagenome]|uniref:Pyrroline-5-carboxylate reductase n=1 Tax=hydrothermal vent metagenome TaxID=652676 RepID=A0A3B0R902_9ZZZZ
MLKKPRLALIGGGRMGGALLRGWAKAGCFEPSGSVMVVDPHLTDPVQALVKQNAGRTKTTASKETFSKLEVLILAVKPQMFEQIASDIASILPKNVMIISVIAGISLKRMQAVFGAGPHVRAMPNTAAEIGKSISVLCTNAAVSEPQKTRVTQLLEAVGKVQWLEEEKLMDVVTAVSGSGPAYFFLLVEVLAAAGQAEGLDEELAQKLARETLIGSAALLDRPGQKAAALRAGVTSPGGTTAAALDVMMGNGAFAEMMRNAVSAATRRGTKLRNAG